MNVSEYLFDYLNRKGIDTAFIITGGQAMFLNDAIGKNSSYNVICHHHEQACTMAGDAYGRIKNKPAITLVTAGPGAVNAMNGVVGAYTDSAPMIVISGQTNLRFVEYQEQHGIRQYGVQGINIGPLVQKIVKYFVTIKNPAELNDILDSAYEQATTGRPGPVWLEIPLDIQKAEVPIQSMRFQALPDKFSLGDMRQAAKAVYTQLQKAARPVFLVGQGVSLSGAREIFDSVVHLLQVPVITARLGIDLIESSDPLYVGRPGNYGERSANMAIQNADVIISVGCRLASSLVGHNPMQFGENAHVIVVDIDPEELNKPNCHVDQKVLGDAKIFFECMNEYYDRYQLPTYQSWIRQCNHWRGKYPVVQASYKDERPINSYLFIDELCRQVDSNVMITVDTGSCFHVACQTWKIKKGQHFLTTGGISSMGYWCACIGACLAHDKKETVCITGDGSLQMNIQEFATIRHNNLPIKVFIFNNNGYLLIRHTQRNFMEDRFVGEGPDTGVWCPDSLKIAEAYGIHGVRINSPDEMEAKIKEVLEYDGPVICDVLTPEWQLLIPRVSSEKLPDGTLVAHDYDDMFPFLSREELASTRIGQKSNASDNNEKKF
nr:thiamine pyrophosphate-binding protein [uncultured Sphaerochaeta sp.]